MWGRPRPDLHETSDAAWFDPADVTALPVEPAARQLIVHALSDADEPYLEGAATYVARCWRRSWR
jgi:hypothetical protein